VPSARSADSARHADDADRAAIAANATNADNATAATRAPVARLDYQSTVTPLPANINMTTRGTVFCPAGLNVTGGGATVADPVNGFINESSPLGRAGWEARGSSFTAQNMTVFVICAQAASTTP
jgi:hypothetical protein